MGETLRLTMDCAAVMMCLATSTGSIAAMRMRRARPCRRSISTDRRPPSQARRDADLPGGSPGQLLQREHLVRRKALEEAVLDHARAPA